VKSILAHLELLKWPEMANIGAPKLTKIDFTKNLQTQCEQD